MFGGFEDIFLESNKKENRISQEVKKHIMCSLYN